jgi:glutathione S-transferase
MYYTVIGTVKSRAARVLWMLEELGQPYEHVRCPPAPSGGDGGEPRRQGAGASGRRPRAITDSTAIIQFLADRHGALTHPAGTLDRARQDSLTHFLLDELDAILWTAARHSFILPEDKRCPEVKESLKWEYARSLTRLADRLGEGPFLMGETMTVPDIARPLPARWRGKGAAPAPRWRPLRGATGPWAARRAEGRAARVRPLPRAKPVLRCCFCGVAA